MTNVNGQKHMDHKNKTVWRKLCSEDYNSLISEDFMCRELEKKKIILNNKNSNPR